MDKNAVELVQNKKSLRFFNRLFLAPKPNNCWRPILDLSKLNLFLKAEKFKMETPETIRTSLQQGVTSIDFKDAYFHIPIQEQSRKYHIQNRTYQFKTLPFSLSTAPMEFIVIAKEVKLMAIHKGIRIHLDDWLVRARCHQICLQHTQEAQIKNGSAPLLAGEFREIRAGAQTSLRLCRLPVRAQIRSGPTDTGPVAEPQQRILALLCLPACPVRQFLSANSHRNTSSPRSTAHETHTVASHWRVPEPLEKVIPILSSLHPHLQWWLEEDNVLQGKP